MASLALGDITYWPCWLTALVFSAMVVLNFVRYCGGGEDKAEEEAEVTKAVVV